MPRPFPKCENVKFFDDNDWAIFGGAEAWANGDLPLFGTSGDNRPILGVEDTAFIADANRIEIHTNSGEAYYYPVVFPTQKGAELFIRNLPLTWEGIEEMGFLPLD